MAGVSKEFVFIDGIFALNVSVAQCEELDVHEMWVIEKTFLCQNLLGMNRYESS
jgi:hypothetical protein